MSKGKLLERRQQSIATLRQREQAAREELKKTKYQEEKRLFNLQWDIDKQRQKEIEDAKAQERLQVERELYNWKGQAEAEAAASERDAPATKAEKPREEEGENARNPPPVRSSSGPIRVKFTPRAVNGPAREEKDEGRSISFSAAHPELAI